MADERLAGIGVGCPGNIDLEKGVVIDAANLSWKNFQIREALEEEFKCPAVVLNDVDAGVYGEYRFGAGKAARCLVGVFPGTGIGGGCVYEGKVLRGKNISCFEIGHMQINPNGLPCGCGRIGCLETEASRLAISAAAAAAAFRGEAPHLLAAAGTDLANIRSGVLAEAIQAGDARHRADRRAGRPAHRLGGGRRGEFARPRHRRARRRTGRGDARAVCRGSGAGRPRSGPPRRSARLSKSPQLNWETTPSSAVRPRGPRRCKNEMKSRVPESKVQASKVQDLNPEA